MKIDKLVLGAIDNNTYIVSNGKRGLIVDPSNGFDQIMAAVDGLTVEAILLTHAHWDHVYALAQVKEATGAKIYMHKADLPLLMSSIRRIGEKYIEPDVLLTGGETLDIIGEQVQVMHTPGHAMGCVCYLIQDCMFCGDTLFKGSIGRTDLETSQPEVMQESLKKFRELDKDYRLYCGHGENSTLAEELAHNPFLQVRA